MKKILLANTDLVAVVDGRDFARVSAYEWAAVTVKGHTYARAFDKVLKRRMYMHELVLRHFSASYLLRGIPGCGSCIDHRDGDGLNNRRKNLRLASVSQNQQNSTGQPSKRRSMFKGVSPGTGRMAGKWRASIKHEGKQQHLGYFSSEEEAARAYNSAAIETFAEFAKLNDVPDTPK